MGRCRLVGVAYTERWGGARGRWAWPCWPWKDLESQVKELGLDPAWGAGELGRGVQADAGSGGV